MSQQQPQQIQGTIQTRTALLIFCRDVANPIVLYFENPMKVYEHLRGLMNSKQIQMVEFEPLGPIKKAAILSNNIMSVALQEERYLAQAPQPQPQHPNVEEDVKSDSENKPEGEEK